MLRREIIWSFMVDNQFFDEVREQSQIKARIVAKYFWAWAKVVIPSARASGNRIAYLDLFAGPGRYEDGTTSTPLMILEKAIADAEMRAMLVTMFNDLDADNVGKLRAAVDALPGIRTLKYAPQISNEEVGEQLAAMFSAVKWIPTFFFVDPWGYKGLSLGLINSVLQNWGCDCIFFFNYNRVNMGLHNESVRNHMDILFGSVRADELRANLAGLPSDDRENMILEYLAQSLKALGAGFVLPFTFKNDKGTRTKHHLIFVTKHHKGYEIMKEIMAKESSERVQGVASFEFSPATERNQLLFELSRPLDDLADMLLKDFAGETVATRDIYLRHNIDRPYILSNYKQALANLESEQRVQAQPPADKRRKRGGKVTFGDEVKVIFPRKP
jgi:three-Cys-motif partner protein